MADSGPPNETSSGEVIGFLQLLIVSVCFEGAAMDPRSLLGPTFVVLVLLVGTIGVLGVGIPTDPELSVHDVNWDDSAAVKAALEQEVSNAMYEEFVYKALVGGGFCLIILWPFSTEKPNFLVRVILLAFCGFTAAILTGNALAAQGALLRICILGGLLIAGLWIVKICNKTAPTNSREPQCFRWAPRHRVLPEVDDPATLEKLERLRAISSEPPPVPS